MYVDPTVSYASIASKNGGELIIVVMPSLAGDPIIALPQGYLASSIEDYILPGTFSFTASVTICNNKITWDNTTQSVKIAEGLDVDIYPVTLMLTSTRTYLPAIDLNFSVKIMGVNPSSINIMTATFDKNTSSIGYKDNGVYAFSKTWLGSLSNGSHAITFEMDGGTNPTLTLSVNDSTTKDPVSPPTGDNADTLWVSCLAILSLVGISISILRKKQPSTD